MNVLLITLLILFIILLIFFRRYISLHFKEPKDLIEQYLKKPEEDVIISLTTIPSRIDDMKYTINSLMTQTVKPKKIILNIPKECKNQKYKIPEWFPRDIVEINITDKDYGPGTKIIPQILKQNKDQKIIYLDDDTLYFDMFIETLVKQSNEYPNHAIAMCGDTHFGKYNKNIIYKNSFCDIEVLHGWAGVLVKPKFFEAKLNFENIPKELFFMDDHWLSLCLSNTKKMCHISQKTDISFKSKGIFLKEISLPHIKELIGGVVLKINKNSLSSTVNNHTDRFKAGLKYFEQEHI